MKAKYYLRFNTHFILRLSITFILMMSVSSSYFTFAKDNKKDERPFPNINLPVEEGANSSRPSSSDFQIVLTPQQPKKDEKKKSRKSTNKVAAASSSSSSNSNSISSFSTSSKADKNHKNLKTNKYKISQAPSLQAKTSPNSKVRSGISSKTLSSSSPLPYNPKKLTQLKAASLPTAQPRKKATSPPLSDSGTNNNPSPSEETAAQNLSLVNIQVLDNKGSDWLNDGVGLLLDGHWIALPLEYVLENTAQSKKSRFWLEQPRQELRFVDMNIESSIALFYVPTALSMAENSVDINKMNYTDDAVDNKTTVPFSASQEDRAPASSTFSLNDSSASRSKAGHNRSKMTYQTVARIAQAGQKILESRMSHNKIAPLDLNSNMSNFDIWKDQIRTTLYQWQTRQFQSILKQNKSITSSPEMSCRITDARVANINLLGLIKNMQQMECSSRSQLRMGFQASSGIDLSVSDINLLTANPNTETLQQITEAVSQNQMSNFVAQVLQVNFSTSPSCRSFSVAQGKAEANTLQIYYCTSAVKTIPEYAHTVVSLMNVMSPTQLRVITAHLKTFHSRPTQAYLKAMLEGFDQVRVPSSSRAVEVKSTAQTSSLKQSLWSDLLKFPWSLSMFSSASTGDRSRTLQPTELHFPELESSSPQSAASLLENYDQSFLEVQKKAFLTDP